MKLLKNEVEKRLVVKLNKSMKDDISSGIMNYGEFNDYPQIIERLILGSQTGRACANIFGKFIAGQGFTNDAINNINVGKDAYGKDIKLAKLLRQFAQSISFFNGAYIHNRFNNDAKIVESKIVQFKNCRLSRIDDNNFCARIAYSDKFVTDENKLNSLKSSELKWYNMFNVSAVQNQIKQSGGIEKYKGQIYHFFLDDTYVYPLSQFDSVYLDLDTEYQIQLFKNREIRNGFSDKVAMNINVLADEETKKDTVYECQKWMGPDGDKLIIFENEFDENGLVSEKNFKLDKVSTNINDKLFDGWEKSLPNNIRKSIFALPAVLIDYEQGQLSQASGEMIKQAVNYYNSITEGIRQAVSESFKEIFINSNNEILSKNIDWTIKPIEINL